MKGKRKKPERPERGEREAYGIGRGHRLQASFTIEAALLVPILLAVLFLLLQSILYLHDTVRAEVWLSEQAVWARRESENDRVPAEGTREAAPRRAVLRGGNHSVTKRWFSIQAEASFEIRMLSRFVAVFFDGPARSRMKRVTEKIMDTPGFLRIAGAIQEELEE